MAAPSSTFMLLRAATCPGAVRAQEVERMAEADRWRASSWGELPASNEARSCIAQDAFDALIGRLID